MPGVADEFAQFRSPVKDEFAQFSRPAVPNAEETEIDAVAGRSAPLSPEVDDSGHNMGTRAPLQPGARGGVIELDPMTIEGNPDAGRGLPETLVRRGLSAIGVNNAGPAVDRVASAGYRAVGLGSESVGRTALAQQGARRDWRSTMLPMWNEAALGVPSAVSDTVSQELQRGGEDHPALAKAHAVAGGLLSAVATAPLAAARGTTAVARIASSSLGSGVVGGISAYTHSSEQGADRVRDAAEGVLRGAALTGGLQGLGEVADTARRALGATAETAAGASRLRQAGATLGQIRKVNRQPGGLARFYNNAEEAGLNRTLASADTLGEAASSVRETTGQAIDNLVSRYGSETVPVDDLVSSLRAAYPPGRGITPEVRQARGYIDDIIERVRAESPDGEVPLSTLQELKQELGAVTNWSARDLTPLDRAQRGLSTAIRDAQESRLGQVAGGDDLAQLQAARRQYGASKTISDVADERARGHIPIPLTDVVTFGAGTAMSGGDWKKGLALAAGRRALNRFGPGISASAAGSLARSIASNPNRYSQIGNTMGRAVSTVYQPGTAATSMRESINAEPEFWGNYASVISQAADRGDDALTATLHTLQQRDPQFRALMQQFQSGAQSGQ